MALSSAPGRKGLGQTIDHHWPSVILGVFIVILAGYGLWAYLSPTPILLGTVPKEERVRLYTSLASASGPLLGFTVASLALLVALTPERRAVEHLKSLAAWSMLPAILLVSAAFLVVTLVLSLIAQIVDAGAQPNQLMEALVLASASTGLFGLLIGGVAFGLVIQRLHQV